VLLGANGSRWEDAIPNRKLSPVRGSVKYTATFNKVGFVEEVEGTCVNAAPPRVTIPAPATVVTETASVPKEEPDPDVERHAAAVSQAAQKREHLQRALANGDAAIRKTKEEAVAGEASEAQACEQLLAHRTALETLEADLQATSAAQEEKIAEHEAAARCLEEECADVAQSALAARARIDATRCERAQKIAEGRAAIVAAEQLEAAKEAAAAAAEDRRALTALAATKLKSRCEMREAEAEAAARESIFRAEAVNAISEERAGKEAERSAADEAAQAASAALAAFTDHATRSRIVEKAELQHVRQHAAAAATLRDIKSRASILGEGQVGFEKVATKARKNAQNLVEVVATTQARHAATAAADRARFAELTAASNEAAAALAGCERQLSCIRARQLDREQSARKAVAAHAAAVAVAAVAREEYEALEARASGTLAEEAASCRAQAAAACEATAAARKKAAAIEAPLRHREEGEAQALARLCEAEAKLAQALQNARSSAEAAVAAAGHRGSNALPPAVVIGAAVKTEPQGDCDSSSSDACKRKSEDKQRTRDEDEEQNKAEDTDGSSGIEGSLGVLQIAEKVQRDGKCVPIGDEKGKVQVDTSGGVQESAADKIDNQELPLITTLNLVRQELDVVDAQVRARRAYQAGVRAEATQKISAWQEERKALLVSLHLADLEAAAAREDQKALQQLKAVSPRAQQASPQGRRAPPPSPALGA